jgi:hypothetical protein
LPTQTRRRHRATPWCLGQRPDQASSVLTHSNPALADCGRSRLTLRHTDLPDPVSLRVGHRTSSSRHERHRITLGREPPGATGREPETGRHRCCIAAGWERRSRTSESPRRLRGTSGHLEGRAHRVSDVSLRSSGRP